MSMSFLSQKRHALFGVERAGGARWIGAWMLALKAGGCARSGLSSRHAAGEVQRWSADLLRRSCADQEVVRRVGVEHVVPIGAAERGGVAAACLRLLLAVRAELLSLAHC